MKHLIYCVALLVALSAAAATATEVYDGLYKDGVVKFKARDYAACRKLMAQALEKAEGPTEQGRVMLYTARAWHAEKNFKAARETCDKMLAMKGLRTTHRREVLALTAKLWTAEKNHAAAREALLKILEIKKLPPATAAHYQFELGMTYFRERNLPAARETFAKVMDVPEAHPNVKAVACFFTVYSMPKEAAAKRREVLAKVLTLKEVSHGYLVQARYRMAQTYMEEKDYPAAKAEFDRVLKMDPLDAKTRKRALNYLEKIKTAAAQPST